jgi:hypothetical protein
MYMVVQSIYHDNKKRLDPKGMKRKRDHGCHGMDGTQPCRGMHLGSVRSHTGSLAGGVILILTGSQRKAPKCSSAPCPSVNLVVSPGRPWRLAALGRGHTEAERCLPACLRRQSPPCPWPWVVPLATSWTQRAHVKELWMVATS